MRRVARVLAWGLLGLLALLAIAWWLAHPAAPDAFYAAPRERPPQPGVLLRSEPFARGVPMDALAWRILYTTTRGDGTPAAASAIVLRSRTATAAPRPVIAWTHGTTGVVPGCAPSLLEDPFANVPALRELIDEGWLYVATDYVGLGTVGPHPYLIGEGQARSALDAVRAARRLPAAAAGDRVVVWGHSQGGHAALWTGVLAPSYAPDVALSGVAAIAPASDLRPMLRAIQHTPVGRIMSAYVLRAYDEAYADVRAEDYVRGPARMLARDMAGRCLAGREALFSVAQALALGGSIFRDDPGAGAFGARLAQNTPDRAVAAPLLIAQGEADDLVLPALQRAFAQRRCAAGQALAYRSYPGRDHLSVLAPEAPLTADLVAWTRERIKGAAAPDNDCSALAQRAAVDGLSAR